MVILTAQSYEGIIYDIPGVLERLLAAGISTRRFFIDEAWGSLNYFSEDTQPLTAMNISALLDKYPDLDVVCIHSAHKSLFCLRQASIIHCRGTRTLAARIETAKYRIHTTSPGDPILASLTNLESETICRRVFSSYWHIHYDPTKAMLDVSSLGTGTLE